MKKTIKSICPVFLWRKIKSLKYFCRSVPYRLDTFFFPTKMKRYCPCCGLRFRSFRAGNYRNLSDKVDVKRYINTRQDVICPYCDSLPRHRIIAMWCVKNINLLQSSEILYFAPEQSMIRWMSRHHIDIITADLYQTADLKIDIQDIALPDSSYDVVFCNHVLEHVEDFRAALKEIYRILRPEGSLICSFPMDPAIDLVHEDSAVQTQAEKIQRFGQQDHNRIFGMNAGLLLSDAGFDVEEIRGGDYPEEILPVIGPANYDMNILFHCRKTGKR